MSNKNFFDIYRRNAYGAITAFPSAKSYRQVFIFAVAVYLVTIPFTATIGAGIKSIFDYFSRKDIEQETIDSTTTSINSLNHETIKPILEEITLQNSKSLSSRQLIKVLKIRIPKALNSAKEKQLSTKKRELQEAQIRNTFPLNVLEILENLDSPCNSCWIPKFELKEEYKQAFDVYETDINSFYDNQALENQKTVINDYMKAKHNHGKSMMSNICSFFTPSEEELKPVDEEVQRATYS
jgi:hypothetical protein